MKSICFAFLHGFSFFVKAKPYHPGETETFLPDEGLRPVKRENNVPLHTSMLGPLSSLFARLG